MKDYTPVNSVRPLSHEREVSSIPRASPFPGANTTTTTIPANSQSETGADKATGNWVYPSEHQFFHAVLRKQHPSSDAPSSAISPLTSPESLASSISHIIPIHNAVNERAWTLIKAWEGPSSDRCGGPKLHSFHGLGAGALSPKARWNSLIMGYSEPFDRHDWVVERCDGTRVEYIIDFYQGKEDKTKPGALNFFLDVRPKMNSFEGVRMRAERALGFR